MLTEVAKIMKMIHVHLACNAENGTFEGKFTALAFAEMNTLSHSLVTNDYEIVGQNLKFDGNLMKIGNMKIRMLAHGTAGFSWCWDTVVISKEDLVKILNYLMKRGYWDFDEALSELFEQWEKKIPFTVEILDKILENHVKGEENETKR